MLDPGDLLAAQVGGRLQWELQPVTVVFGYLFLPPHRVWWITEVRNIAALGVFVVTAVVVGNLAARLRRAAEESVRLSEEQATRRAMVSICPHRFASSTTAAVSKASRPASRGQAWRDEP